jgi:hypothetical protein
VARFIGTLVGLAVTLGGPAIILFGALDGTTVRGRHLAGAAILVGIGLKIMSWARAR